jgi:hypothetical protein
VHTNMFRMLEMYLRKPKPKRKRQLLIRTACLNYYTESVDDQTAKNWNNT